MGVSGCGKSTIGSLVSQTLGLDYYDGDDLHPKKNIEKMSQGIALNDADRIPWLKKVGDRLAHNPHGCVISCSALKRTYRDIIRAHCPGAIFIHPHGHFDVLYARISNRPGHFMPASLLESQYAILEPLSEDELGLICNVEQSPTEIVRHVYQWLTSLKQQ
ncbi:gluconokinase [Corynebacterium sp. sy017]|uniref:gluconokinase n=1 Tax=unclassified Corynebacterium TaxID=2624378 RepID=UPI001184C2B8|nr:MULTISPECIES: gluconokinase [unclassified Corynebacterium]MBP3087949.1 gluconokinase [Corynebacterium sp. sy017]TSD92750.1 gluconokinase [Corynebacterium sp. SY003]